MTKTLRNPYDVLGLSNSADAAEIKTAYRRLALQYHPDRNPGDKGAEERFKEISEAYATLRDPEARARYDRFGSTRPQASRPDFNTVDWQTIFQEADIDIDWSQRNAVPRTGNAVFDALFGAMTGMMRTSGMLPGENREVGIEVQLGELRGGSVRRVRIPGPSVCATCYGKGVLNSGRMCEVCGGRGFVRGGAEVEVKVPKGAKDGLKLRLKELGGPGRPPGDAYVTLRAALPPGARLEENGTLHADLAVTPFEAERGVMTEFLGVNISVPRGATEGEVIRVSGGGLAGRDLLATLRVGVWSGLWRRVRGALS